jgi:hypothetical protein
MKSKEQKMKETLLCGLVGFNNIESQEAKGQKEFCQESLMPKTNNSYGIQDDLLTQYKKLGIEIIGDHNELFYKVKLPKGWKRIPTEHSMWNKLIDEHSRERGLIFYKAAFYDENSHFSITNRFTIKMNSSYYEHKTDHFNDDMDYWYEVLDGDKVVWATQKIFVKYTLKDLTESRLKEQALQWCATHKIILNDPYANWDLML